MSLRVEEGRVLTMWVSSRLFQVGEIAGMKTGGDRMCGTFKEGQGSQCDEGEQVQRKMAAREKRLQIMWGCVAQGELGLSL